MKKVLRSTIALLLSSAMVFPMAACSSNNSSNSNDGNGKGGSVAGATVGSKSKGKARVIQESDTYYNVSSAELKVTTDSEGKKVTYSEVSTPAVVGDRILANVNVQYEIPEDLAAKMNKLDLDTEAGRDEYNRIANEYFKTGLFVFDMDGNALGSFQLGDFTEFRTAFPGQNGEILVVVNTFRSSDCSSIPKIIAVSESGEKLREIQLESSEGLQDTQIYHLENGNFLLACSGKFFIYNAEGKKIHEETNANLGGRMYCSNGKWYAFMPNFTGSEEVLNVQEIDVDAGKLVGQPIKLTDDRVYSLRQGDKDCFIADTNGISSYDLLTGDQEQILAWKDTDVNFSRLRLGDGRIGSADEMILFQNAVEATEMRTNMDKKAGSTTKLYVVKLTKADKNPHAGKSVLKVGTNNISDVSFIEEVIAYNTNKDNPARVELYDYNPAATAVGYYADFSQTSLTGGTGADKLTMEMLSGEGPDILVGFSGVSKFNNENTLIDMNSLLDSEQGLKREDYFDNVIRAFETDGKLYQMPITFELSGMLVNKSFTGAKESMTFAEFNQMGASIPNTVQMVNDLSYEQLLQAWMEHLSGHFVDNQNKTVSFDSQEFKELLETVKKYGLSSDAAAQKEKDQKLGGGPWMAPVADGGISTFSNGLIATDNTSLKSLEDLSILLNQVGNDKLIFTGVPSSQGIGASAKGMITMGISAAAADPELAWNFISNFLKEETQKTISFNTNAFPVNRNAFKTNCQTELDVNKEMLDSIAEDFKKGLAKEDPSEYMKMTSEQLDMLTAALEKVTQSSGFDSDVWAIVAEEAAGFFSGSRTVEDVCKNIQNRASKIVQER